MTAHQAKALAAASRLHEYGTNFAHDASEANALYATLRAYLEESRKVEEIASVFVAKMDEIHADPRFNGVWVFAHTHGQSYTGPTYGSELDALRAALPRATEASDG